MKQIFLTLGLVVASLATIPLVFSDDDLHEYRQQSLGVPTVTNPAYQEECGSCHIAYPPGLLSSASWKKLMDNLDNHFGDNAELSADIHKQISDFLSKNNADTSDYRRSRKFLRGIDSNNAPLRITETPYFKREHHEIPNRLVKNNDKVRSFSNCNACHAKAEQGLFDEHRVRIPGYGRWDD